MPRRAERTDAELDLMSVEAPCTAEEPHTYTATMASGYGLAGGTYAKSPSGIAERLWR